MARRKQSQSQSPRITKDTVFYVIFVTVWAALSLVASQFIVAFLLKLLVGDSLSQPFWILVYYIISYAVALTLILLVPPRLHQLHRKARTTKKVPAKSSIPLSATRGELGLTDSPTLTDIGLAPVGYIVYAIFANILTAIFSVFSWFNAEESQDIGFGYFITTTDRVFAMIAVVLVAPIAEEIIMRGWLYGKLRSRTGIVVALIVTSLVFAILHGQWNVAVVTFALSAVLCGLREITGTIWSGIILHILVNGTAFYLRYVAQII